MFCGRQEEKQVPFDFAQAGFRSAYPTAWDSSCSAQDNGTEEDALRGWSWVEYKSMAQTMQKSEIRDVVESQHLSRPV